MEGKARTENDPFNKYVSLFIAFNIFYNLYEKKRMGVVNRYVDYLSGDNQRAMRVVGLSNIDQLFDTLSADLTNYLDIIPVFREEYWPSMRLGNGSHGVPIAESLKLAFRNRNKKDTIDLLVKWLYKVRCNLVHGDKSYTDTHQRELLQSSATLLDKVLTHVLDQYLQNYPLNG